MKTTHEQDEENLTPPAERGKGHTKAARRALFANIIDFSKSDRPVTYTDLIRILRAAASLQKRDPNAGIIRILATAVIEDLSFMSQRERFAKEMSVATPDELERVFNSLLSFDE